MADQIDDNQDTNIPSTDELLASLKEIRGLNAVERKKATDYVNKLKEIQEREVGLIQTSERLKAQIYEVSNNPLSPLAQDSTFSQIQAEGISEMLRAKEELILNKDSLIKEKEREIERGEIERAVTSIYFACGGIPDSDSRNKEIKDSRLLPSKIIYNRLAPIIAKDGDGQLVILDERGEIEFNSNGDRKSIGDKIRELKAIESMGNFFVDSQYKQPFNTPPRNTPGNYVDRDKAKQGKADIDAIANGSLRVR
jgi:hypothetical protein